MRRIVRSKADRRAETFFAKLNPQNEVPPIEDAEGFGRARVVISEDGTQIEYEVEYADLTSEPVAAHIHYGAADVAGPVILPLAQGDSPFSGTLTEADFTAPEDAPEGAPTTFAEALEAIRDGETYVNVHTQDLPDGEIRGQLKAGDPPPSDAADLTAGAAPMGILLLAVGAMALVLGLRRFAFTRR